ncbi:MAG: hypothetical protein BJ554DRAFT_3906, partial [Olpidium bornovanus]
MCERKFPEPGSWSGTRHFRQSGFAPWRPAAVPTQVSAPGAPLGVANYCGARIVPGAISTCFSSVPPLPALPALPPSPPCSPLFPKKAIREDISVNLTALEELHAQFNPDLLLVESGGDNLAGRGQDCFPGGCLYARCARARTEKNSVRPPVDAFYRRGAKKIRAKPANFSRELADYIIYVIVSRGAGGGGGLRKADVSGTEPAVASFCGMKKERSLTLLPLNPLSSVVRSLRPGENTFQAATRSPGREAQTSFCFSPPHSPPLAFLPSPPRRSPLTRCRYNPVGPPDHQQDRLGPVRRGGPVRHGPRRPAHARRRAHRVRAGQARRGDGRDHSPHPPRM